MFTQSEQIGTLQVARGPRSMKFAWMAVSLIVVLAATIPLIVFSWSRNILYPGAERQTAAQFQLQFQTTTGLTQKGAYQTSDDLSQVQGWYAQHFGLGHEIPQGDSCVTMTRGEPYLLLQQSLTVTLCAHPTRTLIFIDRNLGLH